VTVGRGVVVGARSTVLHDLPEGMICYGNPAFPMLTYELSIWKSAFKAELNDVGHS
jgi:serine acetyltransferase